MKWLESIRDDVNSYVLAEFVSEVYIPGPLIYKNDKIEGSLFMMDPDKDGLYHYRLKLPDLGSVQFSNPQALKDDYYFHKGPIGEFLVLFSLYFQCRFYLVSTYDLQRCLKWEQDFLYQKKKAFYYPIVFDTTNSKNFGIDLSEFLDKVLKLPQNKYKKFILACDHYRKALHEITIDSEMVFIRLVSAIESLIDGDSSTQKFKEIISTYSENYPFKNPEKVKVRKDMIIQKENLARVLSTIYNARSEYLHAGQPMPLSPYFNINAKEIGKNWDYDLALETNQNGNPRQNFKYKLPYTYWFESLVNHCLKEYITQNIPASS